jgi:protein disulfide-isomerase/protein disulfide isomerase family A protein 5
MLRYLALSTVLSVATANPEWMTVRGWGDGDKKKVKFLGDDDFSTFREENPQFLAFFFAPWCGHCKNAKPEYAKASESASVPMVAVDCTDYGKSTCSDFGVSGYPTLKYFDSTKDDSVMDYDGARTTAGFLKFFRKLDPNYVPPPFENSVPDHWEDDAGRVIHMTDDHVDAFRKKHPHFMAFFYAPWCGHCKSAKPEFAKASSRFSQRSMPFVAFDCTADGAETCTKHEVKSFPTFKYFNGENTPETCFETSDRDEVDFFNFVEQKLASGVDEEDSDEAPEKAKLMKMRVRQLRRMLKERGARCMGCTQKEDFVSLLQEVWTERAPAPKLSDKPANTETLMQEKNRKKAEILQEEGWAKEDHGNGAVTHAYTLNTLKAHVDKTGGKGALVFFFAPWCTHCKTQKPGFVEASENVKEALAKAEVDNAGPFVAVNCDSTKSLQVDLCKEYKVSGYPKYLWVESVDGEAYEGEAFPGGRSADGFSTWVAEKYGVEWKPPPSFVKDMGF